MDNVTTTLELNYATRLEHLSTHVVAVLAAKYSLNGLTTTVINTCCDKALQISKRMLEIIDKTPAPSS